MVKRLFWIIMLFVFAGLSTAYASDDYVIGDGDTLQLSVWGVSELSVSSIVRPDGKITIPGVGDIMASGYTPQALSVSITEKLQSIVKKPIVTVMVTGVTNNKVYIIGGWTASGEHPLSGRITILKFLSKFGNFKGADLVRAYVLRNGKKLDVNLYSLLIKGELSKDILLKPDDIIYIPDNETSKIYIMGAVTAPKYIYYRENLRILDAILESGGFTKFAKGNGVAVLRKGSDGKTQETTIRVNDHEGRRPERERPSATG
jgi:polysaccharide export outer membrane protein